MAKETLLILGAGRANLPILKTAKALGYRCLVVSRDKGDYPGIKYADQLVLADILNPEQIISALASETEVSAVVSICSDRPLYSQAILCEELGLPGISKFTAICSQQKKYLKQALAKEGCKQAEYQICNDSKQVQTIVNNSDKPVIIKPSVGQGSNGVQLLASLNDFNQLAASGYFSLDQEWIVEEYLPDPFEFGAQAFVDHGKLLFLEFHNDRLLSSQQPIPVEHRFPFQPPVEKMKNGVDFLAEASTQCENAIRALQIENGAVNLDLIYSCDQIYLLELTNRAGANGLVPAISKRFGIDYAQLIIENALRRDITPLWSKRIEVYPHVVSRMIFPPENSLVGGFSVADTANSEMQTSFGVSPECSYCGQLEVESFISEPRKIETITSSNDCIGQIVFSSENENTFNRELDAVLSGISFC